MISKFILLFPQLKLLDLPVADTSISTEVEENADAADTEEATVAEEAE